MSPIYLWDDGGGPKILLEGSAVAVAQDCCCGEVPTGDCTVCCQCWRIKAETTYDGNVSKGSVLSIGTPIVLQWQPETRYSVGDQIASTDGLNFFICTTEGISGSVEPAWNLDSCNSETTDGTVVWERVLEQFVNGCICSLDDTAIDIIDSKGDPVGTLTFEVFRLTYDRIVIKASIVGTVNESYPAQEFTYPGGICSPITFTIETGLLSQLGDITITMNDCADCDSFPSYTYDSVTDLGNGNIRFNFTTPSFDTPDPTRYEAIIISTGPYAGEYPILDLGNFAIDVCGAFVGTDTGTLTVKVSRPSMLLTVYGPEGWAPLTGYELGAAVLSSDSDVYELTSIQAPTAQPAVGTDWAPNTFYSAGDIVHPIAEDPGDPLSLTYYSFKCISPGTSGGSEPNWNTTPGAITADPGFTTGGVYWRRVVVSGGTEPTWDTVVGNTTVEGEITWTRRVSIQVSWCGEIWDLQFESGDEREVCPDSYFLENSYVTLGPYYTYRQTHRNFVEAWEVFGADGLILWRGGGTVRGWDYGYFAGSWVRYDLRYSGYVGYALNRKTLNVRGAVSERGAFGSGLARPVALNYFRQAPNYAVRQLYDKIWNAPWAESNDFLITDDWFDIHTANGITFKWERGVDWPTSAPGISYLPKP